MQQSFQARAGGRSRSLQQANMEPSRVTRSTRVNPGQPSQPGSTLVASPWFPVVFFGPAGWRWAKAKRSSVGLGAAGLGAWNLGDSSTNTSEEAATISNSFLKQKVYVRKEGRATFARMYWLLVVPGGVTHVFLEQTPLGKHWVWKTAAVWSQSAQVDTWIRIWHHEAGMILRIELEVGTATHFRASFDPSFEQVLFKM